MIRTLHNAHKTLKKSEVAVPFQVVRERHAPAVVAQQLRKRRLVELKETERGVGEARRERALPGRHVGRSRGKSMRGSAGVLVSDTEFVPCPCVYICAALPSRWRPKRRSNRYLLQVRISFTKAESCGLSSSALSYKVSCSQANVRAALSVSVHKQSPSTTALGRGFATSAALHGVWRIDACRG